MTTTVSGLPSLEASASMLRDIFIGNSNDKLNNNNNNVKRRQREPPRQPAVVRHSLHGVPFQNGVHQDVAPGLSRALSSSNILDSGAPVIPPRNPPPSLPPPIITSSPLMRPRTEKTCPRSDKTDPTYPKSNKTCPSSESACPRSENCPRSDRTCQKSTTCPKAPYYVADTLHDASFASSSLPSDLAEASIDSDPWRPDESAGRVTINGMLQDEYVYDEKLAILHYSLTGTVLRLPQQCNGR